MRYILSVFALAFLIGPMCADENARIYMRKGTVICGSIASEMIPIQTKFGKLEIPTSQVRSIKLGLHYEPDQKKAILDAVSRLGDSDFKSREKAVETLIRNGRHSLPFLPKSSEDLEVAKRVKSLISAIQDKFKDEIPSYDTVSTLEFEAKGEILLDSLKFSPIDTEFGILTAKISNIDLINIVKFVGGDAKVPGDGKWHKTSFIEKSDRFRIQASGLIDLWPQTPGQYMSAPGGNDNAGAGKNSVYKPGSLVGKIGESGTVFLVGENHLGSASIAGNLYLMVVEATWNAPTNGNYDVIIGPN